MPYRSGFGIGTFGTGLFGVSGAIDGSTDVVYRPAYGRETYGTSIYGTQGNEAINLSITCSAQVIKAGSSLISASASVTSSADVISDALINVFLTSSVSASAEKYAETDGYRTGYGLRTYGTSIYGENVSVEAGLATIAASASLTASANVTAVGAAAITATLSVTSGGEGSVTAAINIPLTSAVTASSAVTRGGASVIAITSSLTASGRFKWEDETDPTDTWTDATDDGIVTWTDSPVREAA